jgi:hypothetical protein
MEPMLPGICLFRKRVARAKIIGFLAAQTPCVVAMEACAGAHFWAREGGRAEIAEADILDLLDCLPQALTECLSPKDAARTRRSRKGRDPGGRQRAT